MDSKIVPLVGDNCVYDQLCMTSVNAIPKATLNFPDNVKAYYALSSMLVNGNQFFQEFFCSDVAMLEFNSSFEFTTIALISYSCFD